MSPPNTRTASTLNLQGNGERQDFLSPRVLTRQAALVCDDLGIDLHGARLRKLVDRYIANGRADIDFRTWFISYSDPTGETAVRNVMGGNK